MMHLKQDNNQEEICRAIDQRLKDQTVLVTFQQEYENKINPPIYWTGRMTVTNRFLSVVTER